MANRHLLYHDLYDIHMKAFTHAKTIDMCKPLTRETHNHRAILSWLMICSCVTALAQLATAIGYSPQGPQIKHAVHITTYILVLRAQRSLLLLSFFFSFRFLYLGLPI